MILRHYGAVIAAMLWFASSCGAEEPLSTRGYAALTEIGRHNSTVMHIGRNRLGVNEIVVIHRDINKPDNGAVDHVRRTSSGRPMHTRYQADFIIALNKALELAGGSAVQAYSELTIIHYDQQLKLPNCQCRRYAERVEEHPYFSYVFLSVAGKWVPKYETEGKKFARSSEFTRTFSPKDAVALAHIAPPNPHADAEFRRRRFLAKTQFAADLAWRRSVVFRPPQYFVHFREPYIMEAVFNGNSRYIKPGTAKFSRYFVGYVWAYAGVCASYLVLDGTTVQTIRTRSIDGVKISSTVVGEIPVDSRFVDKYLYYRKGIETLPDAWEIAKEVLAGNVGGIIDKSVDFASDQVVPWWDFEMFLRKEGCIGAAVDQLETNLLRISDGLPSVQESGIGVAAFADYTTISNDATNLKAISEACYASFDFDYDKIPYCKCMDKLLTEKLMAKELREAISNYYSFLSKGAGQRFDGSCTG